MKCHVKINGRDHTLPTRTPEMDDRINAIQSINKRIRSGELTRREAWAEQYRFVVDCTGEELPPLEEIDVGDLEVSVVEIVNAYQSPAAKAKVDGVMSTLQDAMNRPEFKKFIKALNAGK